MKCESRLYNLLSVDPDGYLAGTQGEGHGYRIRAFGISARIAFADISIFWGGFESSILHFLQKKSRLFFYEMAKRFTKNQLMTRRLVKPMKNQLLEKEHIAAESWLANMKECVEKDGAIFPSE